MTNTSNRTRVSAGVPQGGEFATEAKAENPDLTETTAVHRAELQAGWCSYAIAGSGDKVRSVDLEVPLANLTPGEHLVLREKAQQHLDRFPNLEFEGTSRLRELADEFGVTANEKLVIDPAEVIQWLDANPAWVEDGRTLHPTGGYIRIRTIEDTGTGLLGAPGHSTTYLDENDLPHREDGPASLLTTRTGWRQAWMRHGELDRDGGRPALKKSDGTREWWKDGVWQAAFMAQTDGVDLTKLEMD